MKILAFNTMGNLISTYQILKTRIGLRKLLLVASCWLLVSLSALGQVALTTSKNPGCINNNITFTADVSPSVGGTVEFFNGATSLGIQPVTVSTATLTTSFAAGSYSITAVYSGGGTSNLLIQEVTLVPPTITASPSPQTVCSGDLFTPITVTGVSTFTWSRDYFNELVGPDQFSQGAVTSIVGAFTNLVGSTLTSTFSIIGIDANGCYGTTTARVTVNPAPALTAITGVSEVCIGATNAITLTNSTPGGVWSSNDPLIASISSTGVVTGISSGTVIITYTLTDGNTCVNSVIHTITVKPSPADQVTAADAIICQGQSTSITAVSDVQPPVIVPTTNNDNTNNVRFAQSNPLAVLDKGIPIDLLTPYGINSLAGITITVTVNVDHPRDQEVELYLVAPWGDIANGAKPACNPLIPYNQPYNQPYTQCFSTGVIPLANNNGGAGSNFRNTVFSDAAATSIAAGTAPFSGTFRPVDPTLPFSSLVGNPNGTWRLRMVDEVNTGYTGVFNNWTITFTLPGNGSGGSFTWTTTDAGWTLPGLGNGTFPASPTQTSTYTLTAIGDNGCTSVSTATVTVVQPIIANAGTDQANCNNDSFTLAGNNPAPGTGIWTV